MAGWNADNAAGSTGLGAVTLVEGSSFCISLQNGDIFAHHPHGVFHQDTRILSRWCLTVNGQELEPLGAWTPSPFRATYIGRAVRADGRADSPLTVVRSRELGAGILEDIAVHNYSQQPAACDIVLSVDADFADLFEVKDGMVRDRLSESDVEDGFLLDGYPRTTAQVDYLDEILANGDQKLDVVLQLTADDEELVARLLGRAKETGRSDDNEAVIRHRLDLYHEQTEAVVATYAARGILTQVNGVGDIDEVTNHVIQAVKAPYTV
ncbi:nucleoside monophosphate kinase [Arthrobacter pascens]|nr:nucleoside monophosphate kinase [Arthrobacter pascens]